MSTNGPLAVEQSVHGQPSVQRTDATPAQMQAVRSAVLRNHMADPVYHLARTAGAFLQGFDEGSGWFLVEFWTDDPDSYLPFVDHLNSLPEFAA